MGLGKEFLGFSNSRMAYDDVLSRVALILERGSLEVKVKSSDLIELYRAEDSLDSNTVNLIQEALALFSDGRSYLNVEMKFNKATLSTWLLFVSRCLIRGYDWLSAAKLAGFIDYFENARILGSLQSDLIASLAPSEWLFNVYESRSSARVADVSSVLLRDATLWLVFDDYVAKEVADVTRPNIDGIRNAFDGKSEAGQSLEDDLIARRLTENGWGRLV
ncbi:hypothetical protein AQ790_00525 [Burkholderia pseudomallei]|nr:hypothetical protein AQ790_00525 [Burkholderia pseudomallei]